MLVFLALAGVLAGAMRAGIGEPVAGTVDAAVEVVILVNENVPESVALGEYYAQRRKIPKEQICRVRTRVEEVCSWADLRKEILEPLKAFLASRPRVLYLVPTYGVPVKTSEEKPENDGKGGPGGTITQMVEGRDYCAVDRELELLRVEHPIDGWLQSKFFNRELPLTVEDQVYLVSRLDGPTPEAARALVDNALYGEAYGIEGECFLDTRGMTDPKDGYGSIDVEMKGIAAVYTKNGLEFVHDDKPEVVDLASRANQAHYWGWYTGDVLCSRDEWRFVRGAVGAHLHSFSAGVLRKKDRTWTGPLVYHGITGTCGTVYEPLAAGFPYGTVFLDRFLKGHAFGQAMEMANLFTSWMAIFVGDPLYAPYAAGMKERQEKNRATARSAYQAIAGALDAGETARALTLAQEAAAIGVPYAGAEDTAFLVREAQARAAAGAPAAGAKPAGTVADLKLALDATRAAAEAGDWRRAAVAAKKAVALSPASHDGNLWLGRVLVEVDDAKGALAALEVAARVESGYELGVARGRALRRLGKRAEAVTAFESALAQRFEVACARQLGETLCELKRFAEAAARLEAVYAKYPSDGALALELGKAYVAVKEWGKAIAVLEKGAAAELPASGADVAEYVAGKELLTAAVTGEGKDKARAAALAALVKELKSGRVRPTAAAQAARIADAASELAAAAGTEELKDLPAYPPAGNGLPRLRLASKAAAPVQVLISGPVALSATLPAAAPKSNPRPTDVELLPGVYRIVVSTVEGGKRRAWRRELRLESGRVVALALDEKFGLYLPAK
ncbi:MAG: TIGR03790 family protein [Planctomycetes bacterium]|nr:TIGR03790 family protein [Planctomycetota bacterium]